MTNAVMELLCCVPVAPLAINLVDLAKDRRMATVEAEILLKLAMNKFAMPIHMSRQNVSIEASRKHIVLDAAQAWWDRHHAEIDWS